MRWSPMGWASVLWVSPYHMGYLYSLRVSEIENLHLTSFFQSKIVCQKKQKPIIQYQSDIYARQGKDGVSSCLDGYVAPSDSAPDSSFAQRALGSSTQLPNFPAFSFCKHVLPKECGHSSSRVVCQQLQKEGPPGLLWKCSRS